MTIKGNSKQAKALIEMLKTFDFVEVINAKSSRTPAKSKTGIDISLAEEKQGKTNQYKNSDDLFHKVLNV
ncbi:MAG: hypothetical protein NTX74_01430 [Flavobacterium sp.]|nr:hypothetical protein [Flavobacterium sp.]